MEWFEKTLRPVGGYSRSEDKLFEEFAVDAVIFLHETMLDALLDEGMIDDEIYQKCKELRNL